MKGYCKAGTSCPFLHSKGLPPPASINEQCRYFLASKGSCTEGCRCPFLHGIYDKRCLPALGSSDDAVVPATAKTQKPSPIALAAAQQAAKPQISSTNTSMPTQVDLQEKISVLAEPGTRTVSAAWGVGDGCIEDEENTYFYAFF